MASGTLPEVSLSSPKLYSHRHIPKLFITLLLCKFLPLDSKSIGMVEGLRSIRDADKYEVGDQLTAYLKEFLPQYRAKLSRLKRSSESPLTKNLTVVRQKMGLSSEEQEVFGMIARYHRVRAVENFYDTLTRSPIKSEFVIA